jgi:uncharacterized surface protein with fasciclin (FAS1) repeats
MQLTRRAALLAALLVPSAAPAMAQVLVGGMPMLPSRDIMQNAANSTDHTTLVAALQEAGLADALKARGPFTVFAPTNEAFAAMPASTLYALLKPENKYQLARVLSYHVVPGKFTVRELNRLITAGGGRAVLQTAEGENLTITRQHKTILVTDGKGNTATVTIPNVIQSNGVMYIIDHVLLPG